MAKCVCNSCGIESVADMKELIEEGCPVCGSQECEIYGKED